MRRGFFDNDIAIKLAGCGLIDDARKQLGIEENWVLSSFNRNRLTQPKKRDKLAQNFDTLPGQAQSRILDFIDQTHKLPPAENQDFIMRYQNSQGLDTGEIQLLEAAFRTDNVLLLSGDKRFWNEFFRTPDLVALAFEKLPGRIACFESVLLLLIDRIGFTTVRDRVLPFKEYDGQIKIAFGGSASKTEEQARDALLYELRRLGEDAAKLLHYPLDSGKP